MLYLDMDCLHLDHVFSVRFHSLFHSLRRATPRQTKRIAGLAMAFLHRRHGDVRILVTWYSQEDQVTRNY